MTPQNGKFQVLSFASAGSSVAIPAGTTHMTFAGSNSSTHVHVKIDGVEFVVVPGVPVAIIGTTLSNAGLSGGTSWNHVSFLKYNI
jgi:hypothetical protein